MAVVLITGCSSGIGLQAALAFAREGDTVVATLRDPTRAGALRDQADAEMLDLDIRTLDVADSDSFSACIGAVESEHGAIDVLVNNAGIHRAGALEDLSEADLRQVLEVNLTGPLLLTRAVLPGMRARNRGLILMVSSLSGIAGLPGDVVYAASKFALEGATEALRQEVARWGIRVALVEAGLHATGIMDASLPPDYPPESPYRPLIDWQISQLRQRLPDALDPANLAGLLVRIAHGDDPRLRWPADPLAEKVLDTMLGQEDAARQAFLEAVAECGWWINGEPPP